MKKNKKMTRYAFISHMEDYMRKLLKDPLRADTDEFLKSFRIDGPIALKMLLKKSNPNDETSSILLRTEKIKDNGFDDDGKRKKDSFEITYKIPRKDYTKKMRNLYISLFENNIIKDSPITEECKSLFDEENIINEGAWGYGILDSDSALDAQSTFANQCLSVLVANVQNSNRMGSDAQDLWSNLGVLIDFLKKYKEDEIHFSDEYNAAVDLVKSKLNFLYNNEEFVNAWSEPKSIRSSIKKQYKDVTLLRYQKEIMNVDDPNKIDPIPTRFSVNEEDGGGAIGGGSDGGFMDGIAGATNAQSSGQYVPVRKKKDDESDVMRRSTIYITEEQAEYIKEATTTQNTGNYAFDKPVSDGNEDSDFYDEALDHKDMMKKSWKGAK